MPQDRQTLVMTKRFVERQIRATQNGAIIGGDSIEVLQQRLNDINAAIIALPSV